MELKAGRTFIDSDGREGLGQIVIGESLARRTGGARTRSARSWCGVIRGAVAIL